MDLKLKGLRALVTGASRGLGYATALGLAQEGALIAINSRNHDKLNAAAQQITQQTGQAVIALTGDLTDPAVPGDLVLKSAAALGGLDILVTNSGGPPAGRFEDMDDAAWQKAVELNLMCHVRLIRAALPYLRKSSAASVLTITSYSAKQPIPNLILSNSIRAATIGLTKSLALELGKDGIRFNSILPASVETERIYELMEYRARVNGTTVAEEILKNTRESPFGRMCRPEEFANAAVFLVSPASPYLTGVMLSIDGGLYKGTL